MGLFEPFRIGPWEARNRFVRSATYEARGDGNGRMTEALLAVYQRLAEGGIGTIVTGYLYVSEEGKPTPLALSAANDDRIPDLARLATTIRQGGSLAVFQLVHAGPQSRKRWTGERPRGPSGGRRDPVTFEKPRPLSHEQIRAVRNDFAQAARRAREAGADGVQIHAAHGYLLSQFLSPFFNRRQDAYGREEQGRYRLVGEVVRAVREAVGEDFLVMVKLNIEDGTPRPGMTPQLAANYAARLAADGVDCVEVSAGATFWAPFVLCRGEKHVDDFVRGLPWPARTLVGRNLRRSAQPPFEEAYNQRAAATVKRRLGEVPLALVGGMRSLDVMEACVDGGVADLISLARPLIREPALVRSLAAGRTHVSRCTNCSRCLAACFSGLPVKCYEKGLPT